MSKKDQRIVADFEQKINWANKNEFNYALILYANAFDMSFDFIRITIVINNH